MSSENELRKDAAVLTTSGTKSSWRDRLVFVIGLLLLTGSLSLMFGGGLRDHFSYSGRKYVFNDDARTWVYHFERYHDPSLFKDDYLGEYATACTAIGVRGLYWASGQFIGAAQFSKLLPYGLLLIVCLAVGAGVARFGGLPAAWLGIALCLSTGVLLDRMVGGLPRSFGFPVVAIGAAALVWGEMTWLAVVTVIGAAFYPACAVPGGMALVAVLFLLPQSDRGVAAGWSLQRRWGLVATVLVLSGLVIAPTVLDLRKYGKSIRPADYPEYPEAGPGGRPAGDDQPPYKLFAKSASDVAIRSLLGVGDRWLSLRSDKAQSPVANPIRERAAIVILVGAGLAFVRLMWRDPASRRLAVLLAAAGGGHLLAEWFLPFFYYPPRYVTYPIPIIVFILVAAAPAAVLPPATLVRRRLGNAAGFILFGIGCLLLVGGKGSPTVGLTVWPSPTDRVFPFLETLPKDALIAGWPNIVLDGTSYLTQRRVLLSRESHIPFNAGFALELRRRMRAIIEASFSPEIGPLLRLRDEFGVTHFVVGREDYTEHAPEYFLPFTPWIESAYAQGQAKGFAVLRLISTCSVYDDGNFAVIDLSKLPATTANKQ